MPDNTLYCADSRYAVCSHGRHVQGMALLRRLQPSMTILDFGDFSYGDT
jgi:hypothetical protein